MKNIVLILHLVVTIFLIITILLQSHGQGLSGAFGGGGEFYRSKRGLEKILFWSTIILACLFLLLSIANLVI